MNNLPAFTPTLTLALSQTWERGFLHPAGYDVAHPGGADDVAAVSGDVRRPVALGQHALHGLLHRSRLGVETQGEVFTKIIEKNTTIPTTKSQVFSTTEDNQDVVRVHVLQGERDMAADNMTLGRFELVGIPPALRGVPQIDVTFAIDTDGVVNVSAKDLGTGKSQSIAVTASSGLSEEDIERLISEADDSKEADVARRRLTDLRNRAEGFVYSTERTLEEFAENIDEEDRKNVKSALEKTREAMSGDDIDSIQAAVDELSGLTYQMTEQLYAVLGRQSE